jgi:cellobiose phosphorylase
MRPPYALVNTWYQVPGFRNRGAEAFYTGSIAMGLRTVYDWMFGIKARMDGLLIDPCIPAWMEDLSADFEFRGKNLRIVISNKNHKCILPEKVTVNGVLVSEWRNDPFNGRKQWMIPEQLLESASEILVEM